MKKLQNSIDFKEHANFTNAAFKSKFTEASPLKEPFMEAAKSPYFAATAQATRQAFDAIIEQAGTHSGLVFLKENRLWHRYGPHGGFGLGAPYRILSYKGCALL